jgi:hypothetical protein
MSSCRHTGAHTTDLPQLANLCATDLRGQGERAMQTSFTREVAPELEPVGVQQCPGQGSEPAWSSTTRTEGPKPTR